MRLGVVAVVPFWSQSDNLNADSNYAYLRVVLPEMLKKTEDTLFVVLFPDPRYGSDRWVYADDGLQRNRIKFFAWPYDSQMSTSVTGFDNMRFKRLEDEYGPCIYWLHQVESEAAIFGGYRNSYARITRPCLIVQHHYIIHRSLPYVYETQFPRQWLQIGGSLASERVIYNSDHTHKMAQEAFGEYLNKETMDKLEAKSQVLKFGLLSGDEPRAPLCTTEPPIFLYNHRFENYKKPEITFQVINQLRAKGHKFEVWATQTAGHKVDDFAVDKDIFEASREKYFERISVPAINTINSVHETFCISILDSMCVGHLVVLPNTVTFPELVPKGYPFLFHNQAEQFEMLDRILERWPEDYNRWHTVLIDHARTTFNLKKYVDDYLSIFSAEENHYRENKHKEGTLRNLTHLLESMEKGKPYPLGCLANEARRLTGCQQQAMSNRRVIRETQILRDDITIAFDKNGIILKKV